MNIQSLSQQRKMILVAAVAGTMAMFLPWWSLSIFGSINGLHGEGILIFLCFLAAGIVACMGDESKNLDESSWMLTLIAGGIASLIMLIKFLSWIEILSAISYGFYLAFAAAVAIVAFSYRHRSKGHTLQSGFDTLKNRFTGPPEQSKADTGSTKVINPANDSTNKPTV